MGHRTAYAGEISESFGSPAEFKDSSYAGDGPHLNWKKSQICVPCEAQACSVLINVRVGRRLGPSEEILKNHKSVFAKRNDRGGLVLK